MNLNHTYGFTIKDLKTKEIMLNEQSYENILKEWRARGSIDMLVYEDKTKSGEKARLHIHGIIKFDKKPFIQSLCKKGYAVKLEEIYDLKGWEKYCSKNQQTNSPVSPNKIDNKIYLFDD